MGAGVGLGLLGGSTPHSGSTIISSGWVFLKVLYKYISSDFF